MSDEGERAQHAAPVDPVFPRFFRNGEGPSHEVIGLMAYGLYEEARREWVDDFKVREGRYPSPEELRTYETSWTSSRLDGLKNAAVQVLASYADTLARDIENQALRQALQGRFFRSVMRWLFSATLFCAAALGLLIASSRAGIDVIGALQDLLRRPDHAASTLHPADSPPPTVPLPSAPLPRSEPQTAPAPREPGTSVTPAPPSRR
jgi:hypothetical protein